MEEEAEDRNCAFCLEPVDPPNYVKCAECPHTTYICVTCFRMGAELGTHKRGHNYEVQHSSGAHLFGHRGWSFAHERALLTAVYKNKLGNWKEITNQAKIPHNAKDAQAYFDRVFVRGTVGRFALKMADWPRIRRQLLTSGKMRNIMESGDRLARLLLIREAIAEQDDDDEDVDLAANDAADEVEKLAVDYANHLADEFDKKVALGTDDAQPMPSALHYYRHDEIWRRVSDLQLPPDILDETDDSGQSASERKPSIDSTDEKPPIVVIRGLRGGRGGIQSEIRDRKGKPVEVVMKVHRPPRRGSATGDEAASPRKGRPPIKRRKTTGNVTQTDSTEDAESVLSDEPSTSRGPRPTSTAGVSSSRKPVMLKRKRSLVVGSKKARRTKARLRRLRDLVSVQSPFADRIAAWSELECGLVSAARARRLMPWMIDQEAPILAGAVGRLYEPGGCADAERKLHLGPPPPHPTLKSPTTAAKERSKQFLDDCQLLAYCPDRNDFELELENEAESDVCVLHVEPSADGDRRTVFENEVKFARLERYIRVLAMRRARRNAILEHAKVEQFFEFMKLMTLTRKPASEVLADRPEREQMMARLQGSLTARQLAELKETTTRADELMTTIGRLQELQRDGVTSLRGLDLCKARTPRKKKANFGGGKANEKKKAQLRWQRYKRWQIKQLKAAAKDDDDDDEDEDEEEDEEEEEEEEEEE